jgi:hypothetical protein
MTFTDDQFTPTKFNTAEDKASFANAFVQFVESGFDQRRFTDKLYRRLSNTFGHIAHFNRLGFWETFFTTTGDKVRFLEIVLSYPCYGDPAWTFSDVERALQSWLAVDGRLAKYRNRLAEEIEAGERAELERLRTKFG